MSYKEYQNLVVDYIVKYTEWPRDEAMNVAADVQEFFELLWPPKGVAYELLRESIND